MNIFVVVQILHPELAVAKIMNEKVLQKLNPILFFETVAACF